MADLAALRLRLVLERVALVADKPFLTESGLRGRRRELAKLERQVIEESRRAALRP